MSESISRPITIPRQPFGLSLWQFIVVKLVIMSVFVAILASLQGWASKNSYKPGQCADFKVGLLHGILMPAAFPALILGHDLPIYAPNNTGCNYKIGYILGLNTCGSVFFGLAYWGMGRHPRRNPAQ
jgi:hypothetical protein